MNLVYERARFAQELQTLGKQQQQDAEVFLAALLEAAAPALLDSGTAIIMVGSQQVASVARLLLAQRGHHNIQVQVAAANPLTRKQARARRKASR